MCACIVRSTIADAGVQIAGLVEVQAAGVMVATRRGHVIEQHIFTRQVNAIGVGQGKARDTIDRVAWVGRLHIRAVLRWVGVGVFIKRVVEVNVVVGCEARVDGQAQQPALRGLCRRSWPAKEDFGGGSRPRTPPPKSCN